MKKVCVLALSVLLISVTACLDKNKPEPESPVSQGVQPGQGEMRVDTLQVDTSRAQRSPHDSAAVEKPHVTPDGKHHQVVRKPTPKKQSTVKLPKGQTADENVFDIKGPVSSATYTQGVLLTYNECLFIREANQRLTFNPRGRLTACPDVQVTRDAQGHITRIYRQSDQIRNTFEWRNGRVYRIAVSSGRKADWNECFLRYNERGEVKSYVTKIYSKRGAKTPDDTFTTTITVLKRDAYGNWTMRRFRNPYETRVEKRIINYHKKNK